MEMEPPPLFLTKKKKKTPQQEKKCIPLATIRSIIADHCRDKRITHAALQHLQDAGEIYGRELFVAADAMRDLQGHRTLHERAFRMAVRFIK
jgi:histone H3/H4